MLTPLIFVEKHLSTISLSLPYLKHEHTTAIMSLIYFVVSEMEITVGIYSIHGYFVSETLCSSCLTIVKSELLIWVWTFPGTRWRKILVSPPQHYRLDSVSSQDLHMAVSCTMWAWRSVTLMVFHSSHFILWQKRGKTGTLTQYQMHRKYPVLVLASFECFPCCLLLSLIRGAVILSSCSNTSSSRSLCAYSWFWKTRSRTYSAVCPTVLTLVTKMATQV